MASLAKDDNLRSFDVPEVARHAGGYTIYKIVLQVTPKELTENSYQLVYWKRYSDIRKLYDTLQRYHQAIYRPGKLPDFPEKSGYMERFNPTIIEERRIASQKFLNFALQQVYLRTHEAYKSFFQTGEKVLLPDVETRTLTPESVIPQQTLVPTPVQSVEVHQNKDELLLNVDDESSEEHANNATFPRILEDLSDLHLESSNQDTSPSKNDRDCGESLSDSTTVQSINNTGSDEH